MESLFPDFPFKKVNVILITLIFLLAAVNLFVPVYNHYCLRAYAFDYSIYNFAFYDFAHLKVSPCTIYLDSYPRTFLQDHFSFTLIVLAPLYWVFSWLTGTYTLIIIQWLIIVYGSWGTYKLIRLKTDDLHTSLLATLFYFILLGRFTASVNDCNLAIIGSAVVPVFLYYFEKGKLLKASLLFLFLIINREDFAIWLVFIGVFLMVIHRKDKLKLKLSAWLTLISCVSTVVVFKLLIPAFEDEHHKYSLFNYTALGKTPGEAVRYFFHDPLRVFELLFINHTGSNYYDNVKQEFYWIYFLSGGFILLWRPAYIIPFIPLIAKKMYNDSPIRWSFETYYAVEVVSIMPVICFLAVLTIKSATSRFLLPWIIVCCTVAVTGFEITKVAEHHVALMGDTRKSNFFSADFYKSDYNLHEVYKAMDMIPDNASVVTAAGLTSHLAFRAKIYYLPNIQDAEYLFYLKHTNNWPVSSEDLEKKINELLSQGDWKIISESKDHCLIKKVSQL